MLSITQFPRRFPTAHKRALAASTSVLTGGHSNLFNNIKKTHEIPMLAAAITLSQAVDISLSPLTSQTRAYSVQTKSPKGSMQSFATTSAAALNEDVHDQDEDYNDSYLYGERSDDWYTTANHPKYDASFPGIHRETHTLSSIAMPNLHTCTRQEMLDYFDNTWALTDALFATLQGEEAFMTPPPHQLRHPLIFYYGHPTCFYVNKFVVSGLLDAPVNPEFEQIFEVGVDEMRWDDMSKNEMQWPRVEEVTAYRRKVYQLVREVIETHEGLAPGHAPIDESTQLWALCMALEHDRIHIETSSMLMQEHPAQFFRKNALLPQYHPSAERSTVPAKRPVAGVDYPMNELLPIEANRVTIGKPRDFPTFGWDNEYGHREIDVPACDVSKFLISNGEFYEFVASGGYLEPSYWTQLGWEWRCFRNTKWPVFWVQNGPSGSHQYKLRAIFDVIDMQWDWPAQVNFHEAQAFCKWKTDCESKANNNSEDPSIVYHLTTEPIHHLLRDAPDRSSDTISDQILTVNGRMDEAAGRNTNASFLSMSPVDAMPPSGNGFYDVFGNAWEWCEDMFAALPGFKVHSYYDDFSAPCFDGEHNIIMGGSFISTGDNGASKFARYHFRPHFFQHAGFRVVKQRVDPDTGNIRLPTTCVDAPGPFVHTNPYRTSEYVTVAHNNGVHMDDQSFVDAQALFNELHRRSEDALQSFVVRCGGSDVSQTLLVRNGVDGVTKLQDQVNATDVTLIVLGDSATKEVLDSQFTLVDEAHVPVFIKESDTECRIALQQVTAWKKK